MAKAYRDKTGKYLVTYSTKYGGRGVLDAYKTKARAKKAIRSVLALKSFRKRGYSNPRVMLNTMESAKRSSYRQRKRSKR